MYWVLAMKPLSPDLLGVIYSAGVAPDQWCDALDRCIFHVGARSAVVMSADALTPAEYTLAVMSSQLTSNVNEQKLAHWLTELAPLEAEAHKDLQSKPARQLWFDNEFWTDDAALRQQKQ